MTEVIIKHKIEYVNNRADIDIQEIAQKYIDKELEKEKCHFEFYKYTINGDIIKLYFTKTPWIHIKDIDGNIIC